MGSQEFHKSLYVVGPSSTGKTTLCNAVAKKLHLNENAVVGEVARHVMATQGYTRKDVGSLEMQQAIMDAHLQRENEGRMGAVRLCDRSAIDPIVYAVLTAPNAEEAKRRQDILVHSPLFQLALQGYRDSIFLLLAPVPEWVVDDGVRLIESQARCHDIFKTVLRELDIAFRELGPEMRFLEERIMAVMGMLRL
ncbi:hypothetical protein Hypma_014703 [Hypsizygus marmoreus]|uniref:NadR/Ttd14 AAA domain-containing protein n=1 Tax=Hypsizygus marmoreus TaxID=39966 RepID=A0A369JDC3_HYPMA|nr:hypothetical protein Hypma_014703 [Hypsizygus marmoreus]